MKKVLIGLLVVCFAGVVFADYAGTVDPGQTWVGYMNVFDLNGGYLWGQSWGTADLRASQDDGLYAKLQLNTNCYNAADAYWVDAETGLGAKEMAAAYYYENNDLAGQTATFTFTVVSNDLAGGDVTTTGFVKVLDPDSGWATITSSIEDLTVGEHMLTLPVPAIANPVVQFGFEVYGVLVNPESAEADLAVMIEVDRKAINPTPADNTDVPLNQASLTWTNPAPKVAGDTITCDVYLEKDNDTSDPNFYEAAVVTGLAASELVLADYSVVLTDDDVPYKWRVDCYDPNGLSGPSIFLGGDTWRFGIGDVPPVAEVGGDQYRWLAMEDGDGDPAVATINLSSTYTDDGRSAITDAAWVVGALEGGGDVVITSQNWNAATNTVTAVATATANGWLQFNLEVTDASGTGTDGMHVGVYGTCIEAAQEDPSDPMYQNLDHGDIDGDCDIDLADFAIFASGYLDCLTPKAGCTP